MNLDRRKPSHLHDVDSKSDVCRFAANCIHNITANRKKDKKLFRVWNVQFRMCFAINYPRSGLEAMNLNGLVIKRLITLKICTN
jgi:hypothetical protein